MSKIKIESLTQAELEKRGVFNWPIWTCGVSKFPWEYDVQESCYLLEGDVEVSTEDETVRFGAGDFVVFPKGCRCTWKVISPVKKHYTFD